MGITGAFALIALACGGDSASVQSSASDATAGSAQSRSFRPGAGITAAGGRLAPTVGNECSTNGGNSNRDPIKIAWVSPDTGELAAIGLETLIFDEPTRIVDTYIAEVNNQGGVNGHCFELLPYLWSLSDAAADFGRICTELPAQQPILLIALSLDDTTLECVTLGTQTPTLGLYTTPLNSKFAATEGQLFTDNGSIQHSMYAALSIARQAGYLNSRDRIALLYGQAQQADSIREAMEEASESLGLNYLFASGVSSSFGMLEILLLEQQVHLLKPDLSDDEIEAVRQVYESLPAEQAELLRRMELYYNTIASTWSGEAVTAVLATTGAFDVRRLMRAAEALNWHPKWITNDAQPAFLTLTDAPPQQSQNLAHVSARRAAGDEVPALDRSCGSLRNSATDLPNFSHRMHTDAWNLMTSTCDYLDVIFGAISRISGPITRDSFIEAMSDSSYATASGALIEFTGEDRFGADRFRVLSADPECVLNDWGCMRATTGWMSLDVGAAAG